MYMFISSYHMSVFSVGRSKVPSAHAVRVHLPTSVRFMSRHLTGQKRAFGQQESKYIQPVLRGYLHKPRTAQVCQQRPQPGRSTVAVQSFPSVLLPEGQPGWNRSAEASNISHSPNTQRSLLRDLFKTTLISNPRTDAFLWKKSFPCSLTCLKTVFLDAGFPPPHTS